MAEILDAGRLRTLRQHHGWDQQGLAERAGIDPSVVSRLERGLQDDLRASILVALARALETTVDALLVDPPRPADLDPSLAPELLAALTRIRELTPAQQRQIAALLETYAATLPS